MSQDQALDKNALQVLLTTLRKISKNIKNVKDSIVPKLELTVVELDVLRKSYDSIQKDLEKIVSEFDSTQTQISKNFFLLKESITSQNKIIQENKEGIKDLKPDIQKQTEEITEALKNSQSENLKRFQEFEEAQTKHNEAINNEILNLSENLKRFQEFEDNQTKHNEAINSEILNLSENILPNVIASLGDLGNVIVEIRRSVIGIDSKLITPSGIVAEISVEGKELQQALQNIQQIVYRSEKHKSMVLSIIDSLIETFTGKTLTIDELEGSFIKQMFINARTQVYEETEGIAPRFRQAMDALIALFEDNSIYPVLNLTSVVRSLRDIRKLYETAPVVTK
ncbi:MAG: hypothetical protein ACXADY_12020 [Candidatus Hodarchaeales archaeon]|jgi:chromosome segregation protein